MLPCRELRRLAERLRPLRRLLVSEHCEQEDSTTHRRLANLAILLWCRLAAVAPPGGGRGIMAVVGGEVLAVGGIIDGEQTMVC